VAVDRRTHRPGVDDPVDPRYRDRPLRANLMRPAGNLSPAAGVAAVGKGAATDDAEVVTRVVAGERDAFAVLVARYGALCRRTALLCGAGSDADDVVQEAFVAAYRALPRFRRAEPLRPWLLRIVVNRARNAVRARQRSRALVDRVGYTDLLGDEPVAGALTAQRRAALVAALGRLRPTDREILALRYLLDLSEQETGAALGLVRGTVKSRTARALRRLRDVLDAERVGVGAGDD
jgi:RNA polymerase sigma factor (sigma-70 family)